MPNIISALAAHHNSLNIINIWDLTVYQLNDQFKRQRYIDYYHILSRSVSIWGDKDSKFDDSLWFSNVSDN